MSIVDNLKGSFSSNNEEESDIIVINDENNQEPVVNETISNENYTSYIKDFQFKDNLDIVTIDLPKNLEKIGFQAFDGCSNLKNIIFNNPTPPLIMNDAFTGVFGATITVPKNCLEIYKNTANMPNKEYNEYKEV